MASEVGLPIDPPQRNVNSRYALETGELIRDLRGDEASGKFHHDVMRAFFAERADISKPDIVAPLAERQDVTAAEVAAAWAERRYRLQVDGFIEAAEIAGVTGVPAIAWPNRRAIVGMMPKEMLLERLR